MLCDFGKQFPLSGEAPESLSAYTVCERVYLRRTTVLCLHPAVIHQDLELRYVWSA